MKQIFLKFVSVTAAYLLCLAAGAINIASAQNEIPYYKMKGKIVVTASRIPAAFSDVARTVYVLDSLSINNSPVSTLTDLLEYVAGVDIRQQGISGAQGDISMRGATFEQTLILLDGVKLTDPQTGHHSLNLPVNLSDVERIEVLKGHGSRLYGPNALGGVINIITRKAAGKSADIRTAFGEDRTAELSGSVTLPYRQTNHRLSGSRNTSDGYRENTEYEIHNASYGGSINRGQDQLNLSAGITDKKFGANGFYGSTSTRQWEHTRLTYLKSDLKIRRQRFRLIPAAYWRRHEDHYIWNREHPEWYENRHTTDVFGAELQASFESFLGITSTGGEYSREKIDSNNLGNHERTKNGLFLEHLVEFLGRMKVSGGAYAYHYSDHRWRVWPGFDVGFKLSAAHRVYGTAGVAFRVPTYTELYYSDPEHQSNPNLREEEARSYEIGYALEQGRLSVQLAVFRREGKNLIDWTRAPGDTVWRAENVAEKNTNGLETGVRFKRVALGRGFQIDEIELNYAYLDSRKDSALLLSSYVSNHLRNQFIAGMYFSYSPWNISNAWRGRYEDRLGFDHRIMVDTRLRWRRGRMDLFVDAVNLLDETAGEFILIPDPGRKYKLGAAFKL